MPAAKIQSKQLLEKLHPNLSLNRAFFIFLTRTCTSKGFSIHIFQPGYQMDCCLSVCMLFKWWLLPSVCLGVEQNHDPDEHQCHSVIVSATLTCCLAVFWVRVLVFHLHALSSVSLWCPSPGSNLLVSVSLVGKGGFDFGSWADLHFRRGPEKQCVQSV